MADANPWSLEGWNLTAQSAYLRAHGVARAEARARDAGTTLGGPPPAPKLAATPRDTSKANPWSAAGWSRTAQAQYIVAHGLARAEARARDAGSPLVGPGPPQGRTMAPAALVRPGSPAIYKVPGAGVGFVPPRRRSGALPRVTMALGLAEVAAVLAASSDVSLPAETDALGIAMTTVLQTEARLAAAPALGVAMTTVLQTEARLAAAPSLGITETVSLSAAPDNSRVTTAGVTRVTTDGITRDIKP